MDKLTVPIMWRPSLLLLVLQIILTSTLLTVSASPIEPNSYVHIHKRHISSAFKPPDSSYLLPNAQAKNQDSLKKPSTSPNTMGMTPGAKLFSLPSAYLSNPSPSPLSSRSALAAGASPSPSSLPRSASKESSKGYKLTPAMQDSPSGSASSRNIKDIVPKHESIVIKPKSNKTTDVKKTQNILPLKTIVNDDDNDDDDVDKDESSPRFTVQTFVIITITILIVVTNCAIIMVVAWTEAFSNFNKTFIYSLALADLLIGLFITPYSIFLSVYREWVFESEFFCNIEAYMFTTLVSAKMYSLTWLNVDQYVAVRKPERYNSMMTPARSLCWILFSWVVVISFCCPPLFSFDASIFDEASYFCMVDSKKQVAYVLTAGLLVCTPSVVSNIVTGAYLFTDAFKTQIQFYEKVFVDLAARPWNYHITFTMSVVFLGTWFPFSTVYIIKYFLDWEINNELLFVLGWLGISTCFSQFVVLVLMSQDFRRALMELMPRRSSDAGNDGGTTSRRISSVPSFTDMVASIGGKTRLKPGNASVGGLGSPVCEDISPPTYDVISMSHGTPKDDGYGSKPKRNSTRSSHTGKQSSIRSTHAGSNEISRNSSVSTGSLSYVDASMSTPQKRGNLYSNSPTHV